MIISTGVSGLSLFESAFYCSPRCLIVTQRLAGTELMIAVVGLMTQFRHLNHILNINDPFTLSQAECNFKPFSGSFIGGRTVLRLRPQSTQEKFNWSGLHCNITIRREQTSACRAQPTLHLWPRFTGFWMETCCLILAHSYDWWTSRWTNAEPPAVRPLTTEKWEMRHLDPRWPLH